MKIIFSPSKEMREENIFEQKQKIEEHTTPHFEEKTLFLNKKLTISLFMKSAIIIVLLRFLFDSIIMLLFKVGFAKALFYLEMIDSTSIASVRFLILIFLLLITNLIFFKDKSSKWKAPITILSFFYIAFLGIPLFSERISFVFLYLYEFSIISPSFKIHLYYSIILLFFKQINCIIIIFIFF